jgi:hypothetical protein
MAKRPTQKFQSSNQRDLDTYQQALRLLWQGNRDACIAFISDCLAEEKIETEAPFYRLWIEILADEKDEQSLRALQEHIKKTIHYKHPSWVPSLSLVGLIHYEVGELEAARMTFRMLEKHTHNPYCKELQWVACQAEVSDSPLTPLHLIQRSEDYNHFKRAALLCKRTKDEPSFQKVRRQMRQIFGDHPLTREIKFHEAFGSKEFRKACLIAKSLRISFPQNSEYQFYFAYTASQIQRDQVALKEFLNLNRRLEEQDADVLCSIGRILLKDRDPSTQKLHFSRGKTYLRRAAEKLESAGLSAAYPNTLLARLEEKDMSEQGHCWFLKLPQRQAYELHSRPLERIEFLQRALGEYVKEGDLCFFVSEGSARSPSEPGDWRLLALYKAASNPEWHHLHRWQTTLKLLIRLDVSIPIANMGYSGLGVRGSDKIGLYRLERDQLSKLEEGIRSFTLDDEAYQPIFDQWRSMIS